MQMEKVLEYFISTNKWSVVKALSLVSCCYVFVSLYKTQGISGEERGCLPAVYLDVFRDVSPDYRAASSLGLGGNSSSL